MSSADPSLSLPHQSHTVPTVDPARPLIARTTPCSTPAPYPALITPLGSPQRTRRVIPQSSLHAFPPAMFLSLSPNPRLPAIHPTTPTDRPQLTLIYVIFSDRPHVTALRRTLDQACPTCCAQLSVGEGCEGVQFEDVAMGASEGRRVRSKLSSHQDPANGHPRPPRRYSER